MCYGMNCIYERKGGASPGTCTVPGGREFPRDAECMNDKDESGYCMDCVYSSDLHMCAGEGTSDACLYMCGNPLSDHYQHVLTDTHECDDDDFERRP